MFPFLSLGYVGIFIFSFALNMLPFMSPSNILVAGVAAVAFPRGNVLLIGFLVAFASSLAKLIHYYAAFFAGNFLDDTRTLDVHICWLRRKIEADPSHPRCIVTHRGRGYELRVGVQ